MEKLKKRNRGEVLLVEDDKDVLDIYDEILKAAGFTTFATTSSSDALTYAIVDNVLVYVVVADLNLGTELNGLAVCERIKRHDPLVYTIAITGDAGYNVLKSRQQGIDDYIQKPIGAEGLQNAVAIGYDRSREWRRIAR